MKSNLLFIVADGGGIVSPFLNPTWTEEGFTKNIEAIVSTDPQAGWIFVSDNLNTHMSETLVISIAKMIGVKGKHGY